MKKITIILSIAILIFSCKQQEKKELKVTVDTEFTNYFSPDSDGITGADGIFSVKVNDNKSIFITGDCFLGTVKNKKRDYETKMLNNSFVVIENGKATPVYQGSEENPISAFVPIQDSDVKKWYWCSHGFIKGDTLYAFAMRMYNEIPKDFDKRKFKDKFEEMTALQWAFRVETLDFLKFRLSDLKMISQEEVKYVTDSKIHFGNNVMHDGEYVYFYGTRNDSETQSNMYVARVKFNANNYNTNWEFFNGKTWVQNVKEAKQINPKGFNVSEQFSVFKHKDKYVFLSQLRGLKEPKIYSFISDKPTGDFTNKKLLYSTKEQEVGNVFTYNALAHPQYIKNDELLVSYCVNSLNVKDIFDNVDNYRARFIRVPMDMIMK
jgi:hypothetical protein